MVELENTNRRTASHVKECIEKQVSSCTKCNNIKPILDFHRSSRNKKGIESVCKQCAQEKNKLSYKATEKLKERASLYYKENTDTILLYQSKKAQKDSNSLSDYYLKRLINRALLKHEDEPLNFLCPEILELKRQLINFQREVYGKQRNNYKYTTTKRVLS